GPEDKAELKMWNAQTGDELFSLSLSSGFVIGLDFSQDGRRVATLSGNPTDWSSHKAKIWDAESGREILELTAPTGGIGMGGLSYSPDGQRIARSSRDFILVFDATTGELLVSVPAIQPSRAVFSPDGRRIAAATQGLAKV